MRVSKQSKRNGSADTALRGVSADAVYRALHVGDYPARVLGRRLDGSADLEIPLNGTALLLTQIAVAPDRASCLPGECYLKG